MFNRTSQTPSRTVSLLLALQVLLLFVSTINAAYAEPVILGKVIAIADGDTLTILDEDKQQYRIRLAGIDAPERAQPFGDASRRNLSELAYGRLVAADCPKVDRYKRLVCVVRVDGSDVSFAQIKAGLAWHYKKYANEQSHGDREAYSDAEIEARVARRGLWAETATIPPWEWRHQ